MPANQPCPTIASFLPPEPTIHRVESYFPLSRISSPTMEQEEHPSFNRDHFIRVSERAGYAIEKEGTASPLNLGIFSFHLLPGSCHLRISRKLMLAKFVGLQIPGTSTSSSLYVLYSSICNLIQP